MPARPYTAPLARPMTTKGSSELTQQTWQRDRADGAARVRLPATSGQSGACARPPAVTTTRSPAPVDEAGSAGAASGTIASGGAQVDSARPRLTTRARSATTLAPPATAAASTAQPATAAAGI